MLLVGTQMPGGANEELFAEQMPDPSVSHYLAGRKADKTIKRLQIPLCR